MGIGASIERNCASAEPTIEDSNTMNVSNQTEQSSRRLPRMPGKIGLALGSGAARGWAHIGVIDALIEKGIRIEYVAGTSMGALVGAVYASKKIDILADVARRLDWRQVIYHFLEISFPRSGLIDGTKVEAFVRRYVQLCDIRDLPVPFCAVATDVQTGGEVIIDEGDIIEAVRASISTPGIFTPVIRKGRVLVDGGLVNPVPVDVVRKMGADFVIAVDVSHFVKKEESDKQHRASLAKEQAIPASGPAGDIPGRILQRIRRKFADLDLSARAYTRQWMKESVLPNIFDVMGNSIRIMEAQITESRLKIDRPDVLIRPRVGHLSFMDFHRAEEAIAEGRKAALKQLYGG